MSSKNTILSKKDSELIENLTAKIGLFVTFDQIAKELNAKMSRQEIRNLVSKLVKNGWLVRIKKGSYYITTLESRGSFNISNFVIAQILAKDSYISCEAALQHWGMFDQYLKTLTSVSLKRVTTREIQGTVFKFIVTDQDNFYGWQEVEMEGRLVKIATAEKAILDILNFKRDVNSVELILEKLKDYQDNLDFDRLNKFIEKQSTAVKRSLGFLFDKAGVNSSYLRELTREKLGSSYLVKDGDQFNSKWRLYYHNYLNR